MTRNINEAMLIKVTNTTPPPKKKVRAQPRSPKNDGMEPMCQDPLGQPEAPEPENEVKAARGYVESLTTGKI